MYLVCNEITRVIPVSIDLCVAQIDSTSITIIILNECMEYSPCAAVGVILLRTRADTSVGDFRKS